MHHQAQADAVGAGEEALARCDWEAARAHFEAALAQALEDPRALDGLCIALDWLGETKAARKARERAYVGHRQAGDPRAAAAAALWLAVDHRVGGGSAAVSSGWLARAERCLEGTAACREAGAIEVERAKRAATSEDAQRHASRALALARELHDPDIEIEALAQLGSAAVASGTSGSKTLGSPSPSCAAEHPPNTRKWNEGKAKVNPDQPECTGLQGFLVSLVAPCRDSTPLSLHTREVAGSKPAAAIKKGFRMRMLRRIGTR